MAFDSFASNDQRLSRRGLLRLGGLALGGLAVGVVAACSAPASTPAQPTGAKPVTSGTPSASAGFDWQRHKGQSITVLNVQNSRTDLMTRYQPEFEELTGIKVNRSEEHTSELQS